MEILEFINARVLGPIVPLSLFAVGIYYSLSLKFFYIRHPIIMLRSMFDKSEGEGISPFRAATVALAGTLGVGNIVGVASAIELGGAGALFWMWVSALCAMVLKYAEIVLAIRFRQSDGSRSFGGAMYYIRGVLCGRVGRVLALIFCVFCIINALGMGAMVQVNAAADALFGVAHVPRILTGLVCAIAALFAVSSGMGRLSKVTEGLVPVMSVLYILMSLAVIVMNGEGLPFVLREIFADAFTPDSAFGGAVGFLLSRSLRFGAMRGLLSNEGGCGTATLAYAASNEKSPAKQGFWGIFEVFFDTVVLCSLTGFAILLTLDDPRVFCADGGVMLTVRAFSSSLGEWSGAVLAVAVLLFAFATIICWAQYGAECVEYLLPAEWAKSIYFCFYFVLILAGSVISSAFIWGITDLSLGVMTLINLFALCVLRRQVKDCTKEFFKAQV